ncbi:MAG: UvrD-helicase domain-containing protein [Armatimonadetes bacterium]|nr:UvrD-helicase domain-containing protein [Armatimonadota bacterium]
MNLTDEQKAVVESRASRFTVRASAGSGKTSVLVERYIAQVVEHGLTPDEIVTVTFTRKAAAEMKSRIVARLRELGLFEEAQTAETGPVQTIHSLCERILRENAVTALVSPDFEILEGARATILREEAIRDALLTAIEEETPARRLVEGLSGKGSYQEAAWSHGRIRKAVEDCLDKLRNSGRDRGDFQEIYANADAAMAHWKQHMLASLPGPIGQPENYHEADWGVKLQMVLKNSSVKAPGWVNLGPGESDRALAEDTVGLVWLATTAWDLLEGRMLRDMEFDFALLESKALSLLKDSPETVAKLRRRWKMLLVDEAQDLNPAQYRLFQYLGVPSEMLVGDAKQSIYSFRFAEPALFVARCEEAEVLSLSRNFRSEPPLLRFVDHVFGALWSGHYEPAAERMEDPDDPFATLPADGFEGVELWPMPHRDTTSLAKLVKSLIDEGTEPNELAVLCRTHATIQVLATKLRSLGVAYRIVGAAETFFARLEVRDIANALEALSDPYNDYAMLALARSPFIGISLDSAVIAVSQSPVYEALGREQDWPYDDGLKLRSAWPWFERLRDSIDGLPAWETTAKLLNETGYLERIAKTPNGLQAVANVRKLLDLATREPDMTARDFANRIRDIRSLRHKEGEAPVIDEGEPAVTLMTVHSAKGLEFDVVVVAETQRKLEPRRVDVVIDAPKGLVVAKFDRRISAAYSWLRAETGQREIEEEQRALYVAMTRARKRLCIEVAEEGGYESLASNVARLAGLPNPPHSGLRVRRLPDR